MCCRSGLLEAAEDESVELLSKQLGIEVPQLLLSNRHQYPGLKVPYPHAIPLPSCHPFPHAIHARTLSLHSCHPSPHAICSPLIPAA